MVDLFFKLHVLGLIDLLLELLRRLEVKDNSLLDGLHLGYLVLIYELILRVIKLQEVLHAVFRRRISF